MTDARPSLAPSWNQTDDIVPKRRSRYVRLATHFAVMVGLMYAGMLALDPLYELACGHAGVNNPWIQLPMLSNFVMALNMTIPMASYMMLRRHGWRATAEMSAAMFLPAALTVGPYLLGGMEAGTMIAVSHAAMIPLMAIATVFRSREHASYGHDSRHENEASRASATSATAQVID